MTMAQYSGDPVTWKITDVVPHSDYTPTGQVIPGVQVYVETSNGTKGTLFLPNNVARNEQARMATITEYVSHLENLRGLTGTIGG